MTIAEMFQHYRELSDELENLEKDILRSAAMDHVEMGLPEGEPW